ncbi:MAG: LCP family protein [Butyrivibrio sp.]|nr:LCP family protein [Butyrivibrio sp.]
MSSQKKKKKSRKKNGRKPEQRHSAGVKINNNSADGETEAPAADVENKAEQDTDTVNDEPEVLADTVNTVNDETAACGEEKRQTEPLRETEAEPPEKAEDEPLQKTEDEPPEKTEPSDGRKLKGAKKAVLIVAAVLFAVLLLLMSAYFLLKEYVNRRFLDQINYESTNETFTINENIPTETPSEGETINEEDNIDEVRHGLIQADAKTFFQNGDSAEAGYVTNVLLIGSDVRPGKEWNGNSDAMILISINDKTKKVVMTSFMRDMYVYIPIVDRCSKLNSAHAFGGSELLCQTITGAFKIKVDKYVRVDFYGLMDIIDAAGGVDMLVTPEELPVLNQYITDMCKESGTGMVPDGYYLNESGNVHLSGMQAVAYARIRYVGNSDFERTNRQRKVLGELINNCKKMGISQITELADVALPRVSTNMSRSEIWDIINNAVKYMGYDVVTQRVPFDGAFTSEYINYQQVILPDYVQNVEMMIDGIYGE